MQREVRGRQNKAAELEEMRVHAGEFPISMPTKAVKSVFSLRKSRVIIGGSVADRCRLRKKLTGQESIPQGLKPS